MHLFLIEKNTKLYRIGENIYIENLKKNFKEKILFKKICGVYNFTGEKIHTKTEKFLLENNVFIFNIKVKKREIVSKYPQNINNYITTISPSVLKKLLFLKLQICLDVLAWYSYNTNSSINFAKHFEKKYFNYFKRNIEKKSEKKQLNEINNSIMKKFLELLGISLFDENSLYFDSFGKELYLLSFMIIKCYLLIWCYKRKFFLKENYFNYLFDILDMIILGWSRVIRENFFYDYLNNYKLTNKEINIISKLILDSFIYNNYGIHYKFFKGLQELLCLKNNII